jgi:hypothetical protein
LINVEQHRHWWSMLYSNVYAYHSPHISIYQLVAGLNACWLHCTKFYHDMLLSWTVQSDLGLVHVCADLEVPAAPSAQPTPTVLASASMLVSHAQQTLQVLLAQTLPVHACVGRALVVPLVQHALLEPSPLVVPQHPPMPLAPAAATLALDLPLTLPLQQLPTTHAFASLGLEVPAAHHALPTPLAQEAALIHAWLALPALSAHQTLKVSQIVRLLLALLANSCLLVPTTPRSPASASLDSAQAVPPHPASSAQLAPFLLVAHTMAACLVASALQVLKVPQPGMTVCHPNCHARLAWALLLGLCLPANVPACLALVSTARVLVVPCVQQVVGLLAYLPQMSVPLAPLAPLALQALQALVPAMLPTAPVQLVCGSQQIPRHLHLLSVCASLALAQVRRGGCLFLKNLMHVDLSQKELQAERIMTSAFAEASAHVTNCFTLLLAASQCKTDQCMCGAQLVISTLESI